MRKCCQKYTGKRGEQSMEHITSRQNALMTHIRKLNASRAYRRASGEYLCDGVKLLEEALRWNAPLKTVVLSEGVDAPALPSGVRAVQVPADVMRSISPMETPQGALFTVRLPDTALPETLSGAHYLVLDGVQDPGNVGTILRTADAFDCDGVFLVNACADPYSPKTARATMGAVFRRDVYQCTADELCALLVSQKTQKAADTFLLDNFGGLSPLLCRELAFRVFGGVDFDLASMPDEEKRQAAGRLFAELQALHTGEKTPTVLLREKKPWDFTCVPIRQYEGLVSQETAP